MQQPPTIDPELLAQITIDPELLAKITTLYASQIKNLTIYGPNPDQQATTKLIRLAPALFLYYCVVLGCTRTLACLTNFRHFTTDVATINSMISDEITKS
jgi:hypothetical protein